MATFWGWILSRWRWFWGRRGPARTAREKLGRAGEAAAAEWLRARGWKIAAQNWRSGRDELDLVGRDGAVLVFVEVRARAAGAAVPGYFSVTARKKRAVARAARAYLRGMAAPAAHFRFDIVEVSVSDGRPAEVRHHPNVPLFAKHFHAEFQPGHRT